MPPRTRKDAPTAILMTDPDQPLLPPREGSTTQIRSAYEPAVGDFVHVLTTTGAKFKSSEILYIGSNGLCIRTDLNGPTSAEVSFIPWSAIVGVGLIGSR